MPELPEVEVTRLSLAQRIAGARILAVQQGKPLRWPLGIEPAGLVGLTVDDVRRRGKYLLLDLAPQGLLLIHLGMSGHLHLTPSAPPAGPHDHFDLVTSRGILRLHDPRRFGAVVWAPSQSSLQAQRLLGRLGMEPLGGDFDLAAFQSGLRRRQAPIKQVLLAGDLVVGVGNIYACEALFHAGIRPTLKASRLSAPRAARLHAAIQDVLARSVREGGSTLRDFLDAHGQAGHFQRQAMVYGRENAPCRVCGHPVRSMRQGQRSTFYCPVCQKF